MLIPCCHSAVLLSVHQASAGVELLTSPASLVPQTCQLWATIFFCVFCECPWTSVSNDGKVSLRVRRKAAVWPGVVKNVNSPPCSKSGHNRLSLTPPVVRFSNDSCFDSVQATGLLLAHKRFRKDSSCQNPSSAQWSFVRCQGEMGFCWFWSD